MSENSALPHFAGRIGWSAIALASLVWLFAHVFIIIHFRMLDSDSIMYGLPMTVVTHPLDLKIPYLGDFESYGRTWGHQWPGAMWVRATIFSAVPHARGLDIGIYLVCQWLSAALAGMLVWKVSRARWLALAVGLLIISDRLILTGVQLHRFEAMAGLTVMSLLAFAWRAGDKTPWSWQAAGYAGAFFAPTMHPYAGPLAFVILGSLVLKAFWFRECRRREAVLACTFLALGSASLAAWFLLQPDALEQYLRNVELQKGFSKSYGVVWKGLSHYRLQSGRILWALGAIASLALLAGQPRSIRQMPGFAVLRFALPGLVLGMIFLQTVTRCNNHTYMTLGHPAVAVVISLFAVALMRVRHTFAGWVPSAALIGVALFWGTVTPYRLWQYQKAGRPDLRRVADDILLNIPSGRKVYIPPPLWDSAARMNLSHEYRLWTFAIASAEERRRRYENAAYADARPGDVLIVDRLATRHGDVWGILPTESILNPEPAIWRKTSSVKRLFPGAELDYGYDFEIYEYTGP